MLDGYGKEFPYFRQRKDSLSLASRCDVESFESLLYPEITRGPIDASACALYDSQRSGPEPYSIINKLPREEMIVHFLPWKIRTPS